MSYEAEVPGSNSNSASWQKSLGREGNLSLRQKSFKNRHFSLRNRLSYTGTAPLAAVDDIAENICFHFSDVSLYRSSCLFIFIFVLELLGSCHCLLKSEPHHACSFGEIFVNSAVR